MAYDIVLTAIAGLGNSHWAATIQRLSDDNYWNPTATSWQAAPNFADKKIALTEGASENLGSYTAAVTFTTGNDNPDYCLVRIHEDAVNGDPVRLAGVVRIRGGRQSLPFDPSTYLMGSGTDATKLSFEQHIRILTAGTAGKSRETSPGSNVFEFLGTDGLTVVYTATLGTTAGTRTSVVYA